MLASVPFVFMVVWFWDRGPGYQADDWAQTLMHAEALSERRPYGDIPYISTPLDAAPARQPPGLPALLAGVIALTGGFSWPAIKLAMVVAAFPFFLLAGLAYAREHGRAMGIAVTTMLTVALAASPPAAATHIQTDLGFAGLIWAVLFLLERPEKITWPVTVAVFVLASLAMSYRYLGAALVPTVALVAVLHRARGGLKLLVPIAVWSAGAIAVVALGGPGVITSQVDISRLWGGVVPMIAAYSGAAVEAHLYPMPWDVANDVFHIASLSLAVLGIVVWTRTSWQSPTWVFTVVYLLTLLVAYNRAGRYLIPLHPVMIFGFLHGIRTVLESLRPRWSQFSRPIACGAAWAVSLSALVLLLAREERRGGYLNEIPDAQQLFDFVSAAGGTEEVRVAFIQPRVLAWSTGIPAMVLPGAIPAVLVAEFERQRITHVILDSIDLQVGRTTRIRGVMDVYPCKFEPVFENPSFEVYRFLPDCREDLT